MSVPERGRRTPGSAEEEAMRVDPAYYLGDVLNYGSTSTTTPVSVRAMRARQTADQTFKNTNPNLITPNLVSFDNFGFLDGSTSFIYCSVSGYYLITGNISIAGNNSKENGLEVHHNSLANVDTIVARRTREDIGVSKDYNIATVWRAIKGEYFYVVAVTADTVNNTLTAASDYSLSISSVLLGVASTRSTRFDSYRFAAAFGG